VRKRAGNRCEGWLDDHEGIPSYRCTKRGDDVDLYLGFQAWLGEDEITERDIMLFCEDCYDNSSIAEEFADFGHIGLEPCALPPLGRSTMIATCTLERGECFASELLPLAVLVLAAGLLALPLRRSNASHSSRRSSVGLQKFMSGKVVLRCSTTTAEEISAAG
jgi:hypothetical protein